MSEKIVGYLLLIVGILIIVFAAVDGYQVFTKQKQPVKLFAFAPVSMDITQALSAGIPKELTQAGFSLPPQKQEIISSEMVNQPANLFAHLMLMGFIATIGGRLAGIGVQLLRPIVVKVNQQTPNNLQKTVPKN